jgi:drug/metabolite transporter (DMT)-like permease
MPEQRLTVARISAGVLGLGGIALIQLPVLTGLSFDRRTAIGGTYVIGAAILIALANVILKRALSDLKPVVLIWGQTLVATPMLWAISLAAESEKVAGWTPRAISALLYLAIFGTIFTYLTLFWLLPRLPLAAVGAIPLIDTLVAVMLGSLFLHETLTWKYAAGAALILTAAALANLSGLRRPVPGLRA